MSVQRVEPEFVELLPATLAAGVLYVSMQYATTVHLCACGCGNRVTLPLSPAQWQLGFDGESITLAPSVGNWQFPCRSHYWIRRNAVLWARTWSENQASAAARRDSAALQRHFSHSPERDDDDRGDRRPAALGRVRAVLRRRLGRRQG